VRTALQTARLLCELSHEVRALRPDMEFLHIDTCEYYAPASKAEEARADFLNQRRLFLHDLLLGRIHEEHPLRPWLRAHGVSSGELSWFEEHPAIIHKVGLDYYRQSEWLVTEEGQEWTGRAIGPAKVMRQYAEHLRLPIILGETNVFGPVPSRISWLKFVTEEVERLESEGIPVEKFCWYPLFSTDWSGGNLVREPLGTIDPQGLFELDDALWGRQPTELTDWYRKLAQGEARSADLPAYRFDPDTADYLKGTLHLMRHWEWQHAPENSFACVVT
jgi:hypothetical protein